MASIDDSHISFATDMLVKFGLEHPRGRLNIGTLVVVGEKVLTVILVFAPQLLPQD